MKRTLALLAATAALLVIGVPVASAAVIEISIDTVVTAPEGSITVLATADTPPDLIGVSCIGTAKATNQTSVHPGNDLIVASGDNSVVLEDVERNAGAITRAGSPLTLGPTVTVSLGMGRDGVFSGGIVVAIGECTPPTTTTTEPSTTTTSEATTTTTQAPIPAIVIEKTADPVEYGVDGVGHFTIKVTNPGPVDLTNVRVSDDVALAVDPGSECPNPEIPDLAVGESHHYDCTVANLDGVSPFTNVATAIGRGPNGTEVTDTDDASVVPPVIATTITQPPTTAPPTTAVPPTTLPVTGVAFERVRGSSIAGFTLLLGGIALLSAAAMIGRLREESQTSSPMPLRDEIWITLMPRRDGSTIYIPLHPADSDRSSPSS